MAGASCSPFWVSFVIDSQDENLGKIVSVYFLNLSNGYIRFLALKEPLKNRKVVCVN